MSKGLAVIYDRASTQKQSENYTRKDVARVGKELAIRYGYDTEPEPRFEIKSGEDLKNRPAILGILTEIQNGKTATGEKIAAIIVPNFTRLSRDEDIIDGLIIKKICRDYGVVVIDFNGKKYNFENDNDQDAAFLEFWFASRDKRQLLSNMLRGMKEKALRGMFMGGYAPLGYRVVPSGVVNRRGVVLKKLETHPQEANLIREIFQLYSQMSAAQVAAELNRRGEKLPIKNIKGIKKEESRESKSRPFTSADIMRVINNPLYAGWMRWGTKKHSGREPSRLLKDFEPQIHFDPSLQIISQSLFDRAQLIKKERYSIPSRAAFSKYPFSYILKCHSCGSPMGGTLYRSGIQPPYRKHIYRCLIHYEFPEKCPHGQWISAYPVAYAVIPLVVQIIRDRTRLTKALEQAASEYSASSNGTLQQLEVETRAEIEKTSQGLSRLMDSIAEGLLTREEAKTKIQELRDKKERLTRELQGMDERKTVQAELLEAINLINSDLEKALWDMFQYKPQSLARIVRLLFKSHSVVVEGYWDKSIPYNSSHPEKRKGKVVEYQLRDEFQDLYANAEDSLRQRGDGQSPVARAK